MSVLVVEHDPDTVANLREVLGFDGLGVVAVKTAREAAGEADRSRVGAVLIDGESPDGTDDGLIPCLRDAAAGAPVVVITGHTDLLAAVTALQGRAATAPLRPVNPATVRANLARLAEVRAAEQKTIQAARLAAVGELAASVAHELNNAFATVTLRVENLLAKTPDDDARRRALEVVDQEVERMAALVANLLEFTRAGQGQVSTIDVCDEVTRAVELTDHHLTRKGVKAAPEFAPGVPLIQADRQQVRQVLLNLFTNAADAMPGGGRLTVRVGPEELPDGRPGVVLEVADTGVGIPPDVLPRVTEAFFTTKEEGKGTGLGLSICKRIVDDHGGRLGIASRVGAGTTVRVTLPVLPHPN
jgi:signal transduction histidine kinase